MKKFVKLTSLIAFVLAAIALVGCQKTTTVDLEYNQQVIDADYEAIKTLYTDKTITADVALTSECANGTVVTWATSDAAVLGADGKIANLSNGGLLGDGTLPTVKLTATLTYEGLTKTHEVTYTVDKRTQDAKDVEAAIAAYNTTYYLTTLSGFAISFDENNKPVYTKEFVNRNGVEVEFVTTDHLVFTGFNAVVIPPTEAELTGDATSVVEPLTIKFTVGGCTVTKTIDVNIEKDTNKFYTVAEAKADMNKENWDSETKYVIRGVVSAMYQSVADGATSGYQGFYVQEAGTAIYVYSAALSDSICVVHPGDEILMTTTITDYNGLFETSKVDAVQVIGTKEVPEKIEITAENFNKTALAGKDGCLATCAQLVYVSGTMSSGNSARITVALPDGTITSLTCDKRTVGFDALAEVINNLKPGESFAFDGVIGWYNTPQFTMYGANGAKKIDATLTDAQILAIDKATVKITAPTSVNPLSENDLMATAPLGSSIVWTIKEEGTPATIEGGKLKVANFADPSKITLTCKLVKGTEEYAVEKEFEVALVSPLTITEAIAAADSTDGFAANTVVKLQVIAKLDDKTYVAYEGGKYVMVNVGEVTGFAVDKIALATIASVTKTNGTYKFDVKALLSSEDSKVNVAGTMVALNELTSAFGKVQLKNVIIANGAAQVSDTVTVKFYTDATKATAYADGTYYGIEGYALYSSDTEIAFVVTGTYQSFADFKTDSSTEFTIRGVVVIYGGNAAAWIASDEGVLVQIYQSNIFPNNIKLGEYVEVTTTGQLYNACYETKTIKSITRFTNEAPYTRAEIVAAIKANAKTKTITNIKYDGQTQKANKYETIQASGWTFSRVTSNDSEIELKLLDTTLEADSATAWKALPAKMNIYLKDNEGNEVALYSMTSVAALGQDAINSVFSKLMEAKAGNKTLSFVGFNNNYYESGTNAITTKSIMIDIASLTLSE